MRYCALQYALADVQCARSSDFGKNDEIHSTRTHLGNVLKAGDVAWGCVTSIHAQTDQANMYPNQHFASWLDLRQIVFGTPSRFDVQHAVFNESDLEGVRPERVPDVVGIRAVSAASACHSTLAALSAGAFLTETGMQLSDFAGAIRMLNALLFF